VQFSFVVRVRQSLSEVRPSADICTDTTLGVLWCQGASCFMRSGGFLGAANHHRTFGVLERACCEWRMDPQERLPQLDLAASPSSWGGKASLERWPCTGRQGQWLGLRRLSRTTHVRQALRRDSIGSMTSAYRKQPCRCGHGSTIHRPEPGRAKRPRAICYHPGCKCKNYRPTGEGRVKR